MSFIRVPANIKEFSLSETADRRYIIGYYPTNRTRDGKRRKVSIEVRGHPEYVVWGQKRTFARAPQ